MSTLNAIIPALSLALIISAIVPLGDAYPQQDITSHGKYPVQGRCGVSSSIEYEITNGAVQSIETDPETISIVVELDRARQFNSDGTIVLNITRAVMNVDYEFAIFADDVFIDYRLINSTQDYRTIAIDFDANTEEINVVGDASPQGT